MRLVETTKVFIQDADCCDSNSGLDQQLTVSTQDGGGGKYIVISTDRWALNPDEIEDFIKALKEMIPDEEM